MVITMRENKIVVDAGKLCLLLVKKNLDSIKPCLQQFLQFVFV
jgi:hypothetical protein